MDFVFVHKQKIKYIKLNEYLNIFFIIITDYLKQVNAMFISLVNFANLILFCWECSEIVEVHLNFSAYFFMGSYNSIFNFKFVISS